MADLLSAPRACRGLLLRNADVLTMLSPELLRDHDVLIDGARIAAVAPAGRLQAPTGAEQIDARGLVVMPGLSDLHVHPFTATFADIMAPYRQTPDPHRFVLPGQMHLFQYLAAGVLRIQVMAGDPDALELRARVRDGRFLGPAMQVGTPVIDGPVPMMSPSISWLVGDEAGGVQAARLARERGYDFVKPYSALPPAAYDGLMREATRLGMPACGHVPYAVGAERAIASGQHIAHARDHVFAANSEVQGGNAERRARLARAAAAAGVFTQTTIECFLRGEVWLDEGIGRYLQAEDAAYINPLVAHAMAPDSEVMRAVSQSPQWVATFRDMGRWSLEVVHELKRAGATLVTGTDAPGLFMAEGFSLHTELEQLVAHGGLSAFEALQASTVHAANAQGEAEVAGTVSVGARADLLLVRRNPVDDIRATRDIDTVVIGGKPIRRAALDEGLQRIRSRLAGMTP